MTTPADFDHVIRRAAQGDPEAVAALYRRHAQAIFRYIVYRVPTDADAEDLTAEVFLKMVEGLPAYTPTGAPFEAWLYRIAAARVADFHRRAHRRVQTALPDTLLDDSPQPEERVQQTAEIETLRQALIQLPEEHQTILLLRFLENKSHKEVAALLGKSVSAVKTAQYRALARLSDLLGMKAKKRHYLRGEDD